MSGSIATAAPRFDLFVLASGQALEYIVPRGSIIEPATSPHAMAVGAICWLTDALEPFSSQGPTIDGRTKPDIAGQDRTSSSVYGGASGCAGGFPGTSASAPHVAGAAALVSRSQSRVHPGPAPDIPREPGPRPRRGREGQPVWLGTAVAGVGTAGRDPVVPPSSRSPPPGCSTAGSATACRARSPADVPRTFQVAGRGGVPAEATAVTGNLTVTGSDRRRLRLPRSRPDRQPAELDPELPGRRQPGQRGDRGPQRDRHPERDLRRTAGSTTHLIFDVTGYFVPDDSGATYVPLAPARLLDTRFGNGLSGRSRRACRARSRSPAGGGVPADAVAVTGNLTVTGSDRRRLRLPRPDPIANPTELDPELPGR